MQCSRCKGESVFFQTSSGRYLCARHLVQDIEARVRKVIRKNGWIQPGTIIGVIISGEPEERALYSFLSGLIKDRRDVTLLQIPPDYLIRGDHEIFSPAPHERRSRTTIAITQSLDDAATEILSSALKGDLMAGLREIPGSLPVIRPFMTLTRDELTCYIRLIGFEDSGTDTPDKKRDEDEFESDVRSLLTQYSQRHPATPFALVQLGCELSESYTRQKNADSEMKRE